jgi:hypothetical protein
LDEDKEHVASGSSFPKARGGTGDDGDEAEGAQGGVALDDEDIKEFGLEGYDDEEGGGAVLLGAGGNDEEMSEGDTYGDQNGNFEVNLYP